MLRIFRAQTKTKERKDARFKKKRAFVVSIQPGWPKNHALLKKSLKIAAGQYELRMTVEVCVMKV